MADILLEVCVDDVVGLQAAIDGGADRIELCSALSVGGLTPSAGLMTLAGQSSVPCYAMIRPRVGNFIYSADELAVMENDILFAATCGMAGVVFGANLPNGQLDRDVLTRLSDVIGSMPRTLHRAFDLVPDITQAIEIAVDCGFERILTSGRAATAGEGLDNLKAAIDMAAGRISIMPGSGINLETIDTILAHLPVYEVHSSCAALLVQEDPAIKTFGFAGSSTKRTSADVVRALKARLSSF